jgi:uncharacterized protein YceK
MMTNKTTVGRVMCCLLLITSGCGTIEYQKGNRGPGPLRVKGSGVYGGVKLDGQYLYACIAPENPVAPIFWAMAPLVIVDLPLSFVADTVMLPYSIPKAMKTQTEKMEPNQASEAAVLPTRQN